METTFWPLKFPSILVDQGHNLLEQNNIFEIFLNNNQAFFGKFSRQCQLLQSNHQITGTINKKNFMMDAHIYEDIKNITLNFFRNDIHFGRKIYSESDIIVYEKRRGGKCLCADLQLNFDIT
jgi:hypothetical protein